MALKMKKLLTELTAGDVIDPPAGEKKWLWKDGVKRRYTVVAVEPWSRTKKGQFVRINAMCNSPYRDEEAFEISCEMLETKTVKIHASS
jgi:hypothetical protein